MTSIFATFSFEAAHFLPHVPAGHKCGRMHGHNWKVEIFINGEVNDKGFVIDFYDVERAWKEEVYGKVDHRVLNEIPGLENPSTENIVKWIGERVSARIQMIASATNGDFRVFRVCVNETPSFGATWEP